MLTWCILNEELSNLIFAGKTFSQLEKPQSEFYWYTSFKTFGMQKEDKIIFSLHFFFVCCCCFFFKMVIFKREFLKDGVKTVILI